MPFVMSKNAKCSVAYGKKSNGLNRVFANKGYCGKRLGASLYYTPSSSHFFNKTDLEQYLLKAIFLFCHNMRRSKIGLAKNFFILKIIDQTMRFSCWRKLSSQPCESESDSLPLRHS